MKRTFAKQGRPWHLYLYLLVGGGGGQGAVGAVQGRSGPFSERVRWARLGASASSRGTRWRVAYGFAHYSIAALLSATHGHY